MTCPRDALVEYSIKKLEAVIQSEKIRHRERKKLALRMSAQFDAVKTLYIKAAESLGEDDPFCRQLAKAAVALDRTQQDVFEFLEKSKALEDF